MKNRIHILIVLAMIAAILLPMTSASARSNRIEFSGSEWCDPDTLVIEREWWHGDDYHARGLSQTCYDTTSIPQMTGTDYRLDSRMDAFNNFATMKMSGKLRFESAEGGVWDGRWNMPLGSDTITVHAHGEGFYKGLYLLWFLHLDGSFYGYIIDHDD